MSQTAEPVEQVYTLKQDAREMERLDMQHNASKEIIGGLVPNGIWQDLVGRKQELRVADIATGTGLWLFDLDKCFKAVSVQARMQGFDMTDVKYPSKDSHAENIELSVFNCLEPPNQEWVGKFDYIHLRLLFMVLQDDQPNTVLKNCLEMLKPGGYIHWEDLSFKDVIAVRGTSTREHPTRAFEQIKAEVFEKVLVTKRLHQNLPSDIYSAIKELGFQDCKHKRFNSTELEPTSNARLIETLNQNYIRVITDICAAGLSSPSIREAIEPGMDEEKVEQLWTEIKEECRQGAQFQNILHSVYGRKTDSTILDSNQ